MPVGPGWQSEKRWNYRENAFTLSSFFATGPTTTAMVHCRYLLAPTSDEPQIKFNQKTSSIGGAIEKTDQIQTDTLTIDWAHIKRPQIPFETFFGTARLPNNRQLDIELHQTTSDTDSTEQLFKRIVGTLKFEGNPPLEAGAEIIEEIKRKGLDGFLEKQNTENFFLVKDSKGQTIGFTTDKLIVSPPNAQLNIRMADYYYIRGRYAGEQEAFFQSNSSLDEFIWMSKTARSSARVALNKDGTMTVTTFSPQAEEKNYTPGPAAMPDALLEPVLTRLLDSQNKQTIVDIIEPDGKITPTLICPVEPEDVDMAEKAAHILMLEFLDGSGFYQYVCFDNQKQVFKVLIHQDNIYILERTSIKDILKQFPERADYILKKSKILELDQPNRQKSN